MTSRTDLGEFFYPTSRLVMRFRAPGSRDLICICKLGQVTSFAYDVTFLELKL
jgi:hypothetical protein